MMPSSPAVMAGKDEGSVPRATSCAQTRATDSGFNEGGTILLASEDYLLQYTVMPPRCSVLQIEVCP
jgi:hypothetical protein